MTTNQAGADAIDPSGEGPEPIAIVGMGCRFPGDVSRPDQLWKLLVDKVDAISDIPADRFDVAKLFHERQGKRGKIAHRQGGFLGSLRGFDASFFGISPREANVMDPQQRLFLETTWEALEDALIPPLSTAGSKTAVFLGMWSNEYEDRLHRATDDYDVYTTTGTGRYAASGRVSYFFDFQGPSFVVDTACSSALVGIHLAAKSLRGGESEMAVAGGSNILLSPEISIGYSRSKMLSKGDHGDGRCKFGDSSVGGYVRSEGVGVVVLKTLSRALADGDPIRALIRGSAVNNDGRTSGLLVQPAQVGQENMLRTAYESSGVPPASVQYVECHGTGTRAGDPVETQALGNVLGQGRPADREFLVGSIKTNIGHTEAASGVAGLMKAVLSLEHKQIPASLHFNNPNPKIPWDKLPLRIPTELEDWPAHDGPAMAAVNSFGVTATNSHIILEEAPAPAEIPAAPEGDGPWLLPLSARGEDALRALAAEYIELLNDENSPHLGEICYSASVGRSGLDNRLSCVAYNKEEMIDRLQAFIDGEQRLGTWEGIHNAGQEHGLVFVSSGQGPKFWPLAQEFLDSEPVFRETLEKCDAALKKHAGWSLIEEITKPENPLMERTEYTQPALCSYQIALSELWKSRGVKANAVVGHSMGEVSAACISGALSIEDAMLVIYHRGRLIQTLCGKGKMAFVDLPHEKTATYLKGYEDKLSVAAYNSPGNTVISGETAALKEVEAKLKKDEVFCKILESVDFASHSPQMAEIQDALRDSLKDVSPRASDIAFFSTVTGAVVEGEKLGAEYWSENIRQPVLFASAIEKLAREGNDVFVEVAPHPALSQSVQQCLKAGNHEGTVIPSLLRDQDKRLVALAGVGALFTSGLPVELNRIYPRPLRKVKLPLYPWQKEDFWIDEATLGAAETAARRTADGQLAHPLLAQYIRSSTQSDTYLWETRIDMDTFPYLKDHRVRDLVVFPGAAYSEMALAGAREAFPEGPHLLREVEIKKALVLPNKGGVLLQLVIQKRSDGRARFQILSRPESSDPEAGGWDLHSSGRIRYGEGESSASGFQTPESLMGGAASRQSKSEHYDAMKKRELNYGTDFQGVKAVHFLDEAAVAELKFSEGVEGDAAQYGVHPSVLDACFQLGVGLVSGGGRQDDTYLPVGMRSLQVLGNIAEEKELWVHGDIGQAGEGLFESTLHLLNAAGDVLLKVEALRLQKLTQDAGLSDGTNIDDWFYHVQWDEKKLAGDANGSGIKNWLIFADSRGAAERLRELLKKSGASAVLVRPGDSYQADGDEIRMNPGNDADYEKLLADTIVSNDGPTGIAQMWNMDAPSSVHLTLDSLTGAHVRGSVSVVRLLGAMAKADWKKKPRLYIITAGAQTTGRDDGAAEIAQSPVLGLGRVLAYEHPEFTSTLVDLSRPGTDSELEPLARELIARDGEREIALRDDARFVQRVIRSVPDAGASTVSAGSGETSRTITAGDEAFAVVIPPGGLPGTAALRSRKVSAPGEGRVAIRVVAAALDSGDVPGGDEADRAAAEIPGRLCAGEISALGAGVRGLKPGSSVIAVVGGALANRVNAESRFTMPLPPGLNPEDVAAVADYLPAMQALYELARANPGDSVLITRASAGAGLAALHLARLRGCEIHTTAESVEVRNFLRGLGVEQVYDEDSPDYAEQVLRNTDGKGVDIVINSPGDDAGAQAMGALGTFGRYVELGAFNIERNKGRVLELFKSNSAYFTVDMDRLYRERPEQVMELMREILPLLKSGALPRPELEEIRLSEFKNGLEKLSRPERVGSAVFVPDEGRVKVLPALREAAAAGGKFRSDGTYLITGGLGGLGLLTAEWLAENGVGGLALVGRREPSPDARRVIERMEAMGVRVHAYAADVTREQDVADLIQKIDGEMPALAGVFHAAGILDDATLLSMDEERFLSALGPKVSGGWNLHRVLRDRELDCFVMYSSVASLLGTAGQANYAAGNAFMDALARHRRGRSQSGVSIHWGPWAEIGLAAAEANRGERLTSRGMGSIPPEAGMAALDRIFRASGAAQTAFMDFDLADWRKSYPAAADMAFFEHIPLDAPEEQTEAGEESAESSGAFSRDDIMKEAPAKRRAVLEGAVKETMGLVLRTKAARLDVNKPFSQLGVDSLMAIELRNRLEASMGVSLSATLAFSYPTITALTDHLAEKLEISFVEEAPAEAPAEPQVTAEEERENLRRDIEDMSDEDAEAELLAELAAFNQ